MTTIPDDQLYSYSDRLAGKVVLITGERLFLTYASTTVIGIDHPVISQVAERELEGRQRSSVPSTSMPSLVCPSGSELTSISAFRVQS